MTESSGGEVYQTLAAKIQVWQSDSSEQGVGESRELNIRSWLRYAEESRKSCHGEAAASVGK